MLLEVDPLLRDCLQFARDNSEFFFAYRWLLLLFKREVGFDAFPRLLEALLCAPSQHYELFLALALIVSHRQELLLIGHRFDLTLQVSYSI